MADLPLTYCVLLERRVPIPALGEALAKVRGGPLADASRAARGSFGLLAQNLSQPEAEAFASGLSGAGVPALAVPDGLLEDPPATVPLLRCEPREDGLYWSAKDGRPPLLTPWTKLAVVGAAAFKQSSSKVVREDASSMGRRMLGLGLTLATGLPPSMTGAAKREIERTVESSELVLYADFLFENERLRVDAQDFDFSGLGARMAFDATSNLKRLVFLALEARPATPRTEGAAIFEENRPFRDMPYGSLADLEREERWLWTLKALKKL